MRGLHPELPETKAEVAVVVLMIIHKHVTAHPSAFWSVKQLKTLYRCAFCLELWAMAICNSVGSEWDISRRRAEYGFEEYGFKHRAQ